MPDLAVSALTFALQGLDAQQNAIANNIANVDTPGFTATDVSFASSLRDALASNQPDATATVSVSPSAAVPSSNGNNVSLSGQLVQLEQATMSYQADSNLVSDQFKLLSGSMGGQF